MYLKQIEIIGFKSFAKKTQIDLTGNITAVVGPNGSGKSNVADAVKWVLGEQRVKHLRGDKMEDVIFNGTLEKRPLGFAQVSLLIDNSSKILPIDYDEVNITRRLFRSGESQYYINKTLCRHKDIVQLFMDTGLGREGYSIIGQGQVQEIIDGNPLSRRLLIEEAVGIVKYKTKKLEAERRLEKTQMNLDRAEDIISELQKRIEPLRRQSEKAQKYLLMRDELKERELNIYAHRIDEYTEELNKYSSDKQILQNNFSELEESFIVIENKTSYLKETISACETKLSEINSKIYELSSINENAKTQREISKVKFEQNQVSINELDEEIINIQSNIDLLLCQKEEIETSLSELNNQHSKLNKLAEEQKAIVASSFEMQDNFINRESEYKNILYISSKFEENLCENEEKLSVIKTDLHELSIDIDNTKTQINLKQNDYIKLKEQSNTYLKEKDNYENAINETLQKIKVKQSQLSMMKANEDDMQGYGYAVKKILQAGKNGMPAGVCGVLAELIDVEDKYLKAITAAMGGAFRYVVVSDENAAAECINLLNRNKWGRVTFMPISVIRPSVFSSEEKNSFEGKYEAAAYELVKFNPIYDGVVKHILGRVIIAKDINQATQLAKATRHKFKIVTLNGEVFMPGGIVIGGESKSDNIAPLQRKRRIDEIKKEIDLSQNEYDRLVGKSSQNRSLIAKTNEKIENLQKAINELNIKNANISSEFNNLSNFEKSILKQNEDILQQLKLTAEKKEKFLLLLNTDANIEEIKNNYNIQTEKLNIFNIDLVKISENIKYTSDRLLNINIEIDKNRNQLEQNKNKINYLNNESDDLQNKMEQYQQGSDLYETQKTEYKENYDNTLLEKSTANEEFDKSNAELIRLSKEKSEIKDVINSIDLKINNIQLKTEHIAQSIGEEYQIGIDDLAEYKKTIDAFGEYAAKTDEMKKTIKSFGNINVGAVEEYKEVTQRYEFLTSQRDDLLEAKKDIESVIKDVERNMAVQFKQQFYQIQEEFDKAFKKLFAGGAASLIILDEDDLLNTGIDISAQPPGKKLKNISMLSGGEKAMTSIALLFAILKIKPAPFCVLDEIDAALDDNNVSLFAKYINEERKNNQLIIITHKKRTMEVCDCLYGASMGNEGITKIVSLKLTS